MRVFSALLGTETNSFSPLPAGLAEFMGPAFDPVGLADEHLHPFASPMRVARERGREKGWTLFEGKCAFATPSGPTTRHAYETLRDGLLADLKAALPVDLVLLGLHGAMIAEGYDDAEGDLLEHVRAVVGPKTVIGAELDPHGHYSDRKVANADILVFFKEYPHTDMVDRAYDLVDLCERTVKGEIRPVMSVFDLNMLAMYHTSREPMRGFVDRMFALEGKNKVLSVSFIHGFPWGDVPTLGSVMLVITDNDKAAGDALAEKLGREVIAFRDHLKPDILNPEQAVTLAMGHNGAPVVLADSADNAGGGSASDSTFILKVLLEKKVAGAAVGPLWDPGAADICFQAGVGATLPLRIGGKVGPQSGQPLDVLATVTHLRRGAMMKGMSGLDWPLGDVAVVKVDNVHIVLTTYRTQGFGKDMFTQFDIDLEATKILVVKSSQHFYASFGPIASKVVYVDSPGSMPMDFTTLTFTKARKDLWPFKK